MVAIISAVIGALGFLFGIYFHYRTYKVAKLTYQISQIFDFGVPWSLLKDMPRAPVAITITSRGGKATENIALHMTIRSDIDNYDVIPSDVGISHDGSTLSLRVSRLNPSESLKLFLRCTGSPAENQVADFNLSHSEGEGEDERGPGLARDAYKTAAIVGTVGALVISLLFLAIQKLLMSLTTAPLTP